MKVRLGMRQTVLSILLGLICLIPLACGKKGPPLPPEVFAPAAVKELGGTGEVQAFNVTWQPPEATANGKALLDLESFHIKRRLYDKDSPGRFHVIGEVDAVPEDTSKSSSAVQTYQFKDDDVEPGKIYEYVVVGVNEDGVEGLIANLLRATFTGETTRTELIAQDKPSKS